MASGHRSHLDYPELFHAAAYFAVSPPDGANPVAVDARLLFYGLYMQSMYGPVSKTGVTRPWGSFFGGKTEEQEKYDTWAGLGDMTRLEAMMLYVKNMEEDNPNWWELLTENNHPDLVLAITDAAQLAVENDNEPMPELDEYRANPRKFVMRLRSSAGADVSDEEEDEDEEGEEDEEGLPTPSSGGAAISPAAGGAAGEEGPAPSRRRKKEAVPPPPPSFGECLNINDIWARAEVSGTAPYKRYHHAACTLGDKMFVYGGTYNARFLDDLRVLDLRMLEWTHLKSNGGFSHANAPPALSGARMVVHDGKLFLVGGLAKGGSPTLEVRVYNPAADEWSVLNAKGSAPCMRGMHSATLIDGRLWVYGGMDAERHALGDMHVLDLTRLQWTKPVMSAQRPVVAGGPPGRVPPARYAHVAVAQGRFLLVHGGCLANEDVDAGLFALDTQSLTWACVADVGKAPTARSGHASALIGHKWYIGGGGDNTRALADLFALDLRELGVGVVHWHPVVLEAVPREWTKAQSDAGAPCWVEAFGAAHAAAPTRCALATEGLSLVASEEQSLLVAFGGHDGSFYNDVHFLRPSGATVGAGGGAAAAAAPVPVPAAAPVDPRVAATRRAANVVPEPQPPSALASWFGWGTSSS